MTTNTQEREMFWKAKAEKFNVSQEGLFEECADYWLGRIEARESALRLEIEGEVKQKMDVVNEGDLFSRKAVLTILADTLSTIARIFDAKEITERQ